MGRLTVCWSINFVLTIFQSAQTHRRQVAMPDGLSGLLDLPLEVSASHDSDGLQLIQTDLASNSLYSSKSITIAGMPRPATSSPAALYDIDIYRDIPTISLSLSWCRSHIDESAQTSNMFNQGGKGHQEDMGYPARLCRARASSPSWN